MKNFFLTKIIFIIFLYTTIPATSMDLKYYTIYVNPNKNTELVTQKHAKALYPGFNFDDKHDDKLIRIIPIFVAQTNGLISTKILDPDQHFNFLVPYDFLLQDIWNIKSIQTKGLKIENENLLRYQYHHKNDLLKQIADKINQENMIQQQRETQNLNKLTILTVLLETQLSESNQALERLQKEYSSQMTSLINDTKIRSKLIEKLSKAITDYKQTNEQKKKELNAKLAQSNPTQIKSQFPTERTPPTKIIMYCCLLASLALLYTYFTSTNNTIFWFFWFF